MIFLGKFIGPIYCYMIQIAKVRITKNSHIDTWPFPHIDTWPFPHIDTWPLIPSNKEDLPNASKDSSKNKILLHHPLHQN